MKKDILFRKEGAILYTSEILENNFKNFINNSGVLKNINIITKLIQYNKLIVCYRVKSPNINNFNYKTINEFNGFYNYYLNGDSIYIITNGNNLENINNKRDLENIILYELLYYSGENSYNLNIFSNYLNLFYKELFESLLDKSQYKDYWKNLSDYQYRIKDIPKYFDSLPLNGKYETIMDLKDYLEKCLHTTNLTSNEKIFSETIYNIYKKYFKIKIKNDILFKEYTAPSEVIYNLYANNIISIEKIKKIF